MHYIPLTSGSVPFQPSSGHTVPPSGDLWHMWWPWPQVQLHLAPEALFGRKPKLWPPMDNKMFFAWHTLVFSIFRDILLGLALPIVKLFITIQPLGEMLHNGRQCKALGWHHTSISGYNGNKILEKKNRWNVNVNSCYFWLHDNT